MHTSIIHPAHYYPTVRYSSLTLFSVLLLAVPREAIAGLLTSYGINGESWSLNVESMKEIVMNAQYSTSTDESAIVGLFDCFDTDLNGLIDTLEWLVSIALVSGMNVTDKVQFVFSLYDFEKSGLLGRDAVCLLFRSAVKGR